MLFRSFKITCLHCQSNISNVFQFTSCFITYFQLHSGSQWEETVQDPHSGHTLNVHVQKQEDGGYIIMRHWHGENSHVATRVMCSVIVMFKLLIQFCNIIENHNHRGIEIIVTFTHGYNGT